MQANAERRRSEAAAASAAFKAAMAKLATAERHRHAAVLAAEWILKEVYIPTIPINYQESPSADSSATSSPSNFQRNTIHFPTQHYPPTRHNFYN